ncbi:calponin homology domain-containing protein [Naegleria gruberi]|uniref:Calponin homology domain-containing protein n=1 Tax=Naegleria gruberi TaxID=5762 RepID=D2V1U3_NAEGR|nr:calponin homology domain-containing protein [Naegleria gruberi]EFC49221.1 calponin homology domain-containing protein [Naegleria gruberi]|eukprot:XP_002681965.1 calponin homology domain-containing protein [Naegleria gruberi strain NEG-M]
MSKGRDAILRWCQRNSYGYDGVEIDNFDSSFASGLAFCALLDSQRPDLLKESGLEWSDLVNDFSRNERLEWAFGKADEIGIPRLLDPEDVDEQKPDPKVVITYLSGMIRFFQEDDGGSEATIDRPTGSFAASIDDLINGGGKKKPSGGDQTPPPSSAKVPQLKATGKSDSTPPAASPRKDVPVEKQLENLEKMYQKGLLNEESYEKSKQKIMEKIKEQQAQLSARSDHSSNSETSSNSSSSQQTTSEDKTQKALANLQKLYEKGTLSEEEYKKAVEKLKAKSAPVTTSEVKPQQTTEQSSSSSSVDTSKFSPEQLKQYEKLTKMLQSGLLGEAEYQKSLNNLIDKVNKSQPSTSSQQESPVVTKQPNPLIEKIQDTKKLNNLKTLLNKGVITEEEFDKSITKLYQQEQEKQNSAPSTPPPTAEPSFDGVDIDSLKEEDFDEKTKGRVKAIERMYKAGLFKDNEYAHARRKAIMQGLQEAGGKFTPSPVTETKEPEVKPVAEEKPQKKRTNSVFIQQPNLPKEINADVEDYRILYEKLLKEHEKLAADFDEIQEDYEELKEQLSTVYDEKKKDVEVPEELKPVLKKIGLKKKQSGKKLDVVIIYSSDDSLVTEKVTL